MSDHHEYFCDRCHCTDTVWCDGRTRLHPPSGWEQRGDEDWCEDCVKEDAEQRDEEAGAEEQEADAILEAS